MVVIIKRHLGERRRCVAELKRAAASGTGDFKADDAEGIIERWLALQDVHHALGH
jgi:hypothetical protein